MENTGRLKNPALKWVMQITGKLINLALKWVISTALKCPAPEHIEQKLLTYTSTTLKKDGILDQD